MAFSIITADPTWGTPVTSSPLIASGPSPSITPLYDGANSVTADLGAVVNLAAIDTSGITKPTAGWITYNGSGGPGISARGSYINSDSTAVTAWTGDVPSVAAGDLMVAVLMTREAGGTVTPPTGWTQQGPKYLNSIITSGAPQNLSVYTKVAAASEPATVTWTQASSSRICGFIASLVGNNFTMGTVTESYGNGEYASISNAGADFYITGATWVYTTTGSPKAYSQTGPGLTEISDSPQTLSRISGGYTSTDGVVQSYHESDTTTGSPNHGMISIPFTVSSEGGGGGSTRPTSGMLYPRGQG